MILFGLFIGFISVISINIKNEVFEYSQGLEEPYLTGLIEEVDFEELVIKLDNDGYNYVITTGDQYSKDIDIYLNNFDYKLPLDFDENDNLVGTQSFNGSSYHQLDFDNMHNRKFSIKIDGFESLKEYEEYTQVSTTINYGEYYEEVNQYNNLIIILTIIGALLFSYNIVSRNKYEIFVLKLNGFDNFEIVNKIFKKSFKLIILMVVVSICIALPSIFRYIRYFGFDYEIVKAYGYIVCLNFITVIALILYLYFSCFRFNLETMRREYDEVL